MLASEGARFRALVVEKLEHLNLFGTVSHILATRVDICRICIGCCTTSLIYIVVIVVVIIVVVVVVVVIVVMVHQVRVCHNTTLVITMVIITIVRAWPNKCVENIHVFGRAVKSHD